MAFSDYKLCDLCGGKAFYDSNLSYDTGEVVNREWKQPENQFRIVGKEGSGTALGYLGDWAVLCLSCAKTHKTQIVPITGVVP